MFGPDGPVVQHGTVVEAHAAHDRVGRNHITAPRIHEYGQRRRIKVQVDARPRGKVGLHKNRFANADLSPLSSNRFQQAALKCSDKQR